MMSMYLRVAVQEELPVVPVVHADRRAGLVVGRHVRQVVGIAEAFVSAGGADAAGQIQLRLHEAVPDPIARRLDLRVVFERGDVGHAGIHVHRADGVADRLASDR